MLVSVRPSAVQNSRFFRQQLVRSFTSGTVDGFTGAIGNTPLVSVAYMRFYVLVAPILPLLYFEMGYWLANCLTDARGFPRFTSRSCQRRLGQRYTGKPSFRTLEGASRTVLHSGSLAMLRLPGGSFLVSLCGISLRSGGLTR
jgi:hypothetical protein